MKRDEIVKRAYELKGKHRTAVGCAGSHDWCAHFVSNVLNDVGIKGVYDTFCTPLKNKMSQSPEWDEPETFPIAGDIIFFDWDRIKEERPLDHVGIVVAFSGTTVTYIDGNGGGSQYVAMHTINVNSPAVQYWMRYIGDDNNAKPTEHKSADTTPQTPTTSDKTFTHTLRQLKVGCSGSDVKTLQQLLFSKGYAVGGDDGEFGPKTERGVKDYQKNNKLDVDGIVGPQTFKKLWGY